MREVERSLPNHHRFVAVNNKLSIHPLRVGINRGIQMREPPVTRVRHVKPIIMDSADKMKDEPLDEVLMRGLLQQVHESVHINHMMQVGSYDSCSKAQVFY